jgi:hypothetical protein
MPESLNVVDMAVYQSNLDVQTRLGVEFIVTSEPGFNPENRASYENKIKNATFAGDDAWDIVAAMTCHMPEIVVSGALTDLNQTKYLNMSKPYWMQDLVDQASVDGKLYFATGDASLSLAKQTMIILYNKELAENNGYADIQQTALDGDFTIELMRKIAKESYRGADASTVDVKSDTFGFGIGNFNHLSAFGASLGLQIMKKEANGSFTFTYGNERATTIVPYLCEMFNTDPGFIITDNTGKNSDEVRTSFLSGRMMFVSATYAELMDFSEIAGEFSVLPFPKWDAEDDYATFARNTYMCYGIMTTCQDTELASAVLECMASTNYAGLTQVFYEKALKIRYSDSPMAASIVGLITDSVSFDIGFTYSYMLRTLDFDQLLNRSILNNNSNWMSTVAQRKRSVEKVINEYIESVRNIGNT